MRSQNAAIRSGVLHEDIGRSLEVQGSTDRSFGLVFAAVFAVVGFWNVMGTGPVHWWAFAIAAAFALVALVRPGLLCPLNKLWRDFGLLLGRITTPLVLGLIFFGVVTPTALASRLSGRDVLARRQLSGAWVMRKPGANKGEQMRRQF